MRIETQKGKKTQHSENAHAAIFYGTFLVYYFPKISSVWFLVFNYAFILAKCRGLD
jgi:hypothetical protein